VLLITAEITGRWCEGLTSGHSTGTHPGLARNVCGTPCFEGLEDSGKGKDGDSEATGTSDLHGLLCFGIARGAHRRTVLQKLRPCTCICTRTCVATRSL